MKTSENTQITTKLIPRLVQEAKIPIENIKTDCATSLTSNKRVDIIISSLENTSSKFDENIICVIEVKQKNAKVLDIYIKDLVTDKIVVDADILALITKNLEAYELNSNQVNYGTIQEKEWFNALVQGKWKAQKIGLPFFAVSNVDTINFYHTKTLMPLFLKRTVASVKNGRIEHYDVTEELRGLPSYRLLIDLKNSISDENLVCDYRMLKQDEQNEKVSMSEKQFIDFLTRIHNEFYKNSLKGNKKYLGDIILTFLFFKYLEERIQIQRTVSRYKSNDIPLWSEWVSQKELNDIQKHESIGKQIYDKIKAQLELLSNLDDEKDSSGEYSTGYEKEYRDFSSVLADVSNIPKNKSGYEFLAKIYKELNGYNTATNQKDKSLYLHACNFDVYGAIYEKFKEKDEKEELGQYYTKRHISRILARLTLKPYVDKMISEIEKVEADKESTGNTMLPKDVINIIKKHYSKLKVIDPSCGTGGLLTECYDYLEEQYRNRVNGKNDAIEKILSERMFTGIDIEDDCVKKAKLNMFFAGDGHTDLYRGSSLEPIPNQEKRLMDDCNLNEWNVIVSNPPYGKGKEYMFIEKYIKALPYGGRVGIIIPNGVLENPSKVKFRKMLISNIKVESIISLNKYVFAPYTKQKTYMLIGYKREESTINNINEQFIIEESNYIDYSQENIQFGNIKDNIWCYILDFDGYNLSDNRWETDLIETNDSIPRYIHNDTFELLTEYLNIEPIVKINQLDIDGSYIGKKTLDGNYHLNKSGFIKINDVCSEDNYYNLLPEFYMRPYEPEYITEQELISESEMLRYKISKLAEFFKPEKVTDIDE